MAPYSVEELRGKPVVSQDGRELGEVESFIVDTATWRIDKVAVKLNKGVLDDLSLRRPFIGTQVIQVRASDISGVSDTLVLKSDLANLRFDGGEAEEPVTVPEEAERSGGESA